MSLRWVYIRRSRVVATGPMQRWRRAAGLACLAALCAAPWSCAEGPRGASAATGAAEAAGPGVLMENVTVHHSRGGAASFVAHARRLELYEGWRRFAAADAGVWLPRHEVRLEAGAVTGSTQDGALEARGGVALAAADGLRAWSPALRFERRRGDGGTASSDAGIRVHRAGLALAAASFEFDLAEQRVVLDAVASTLEPPGGEGRGEAGGGGDGGVDFRRR